MGQATTLTALYHLLERPHRVDQRQLDLDSARGQGAAQLTSAWAWADPAAAAPPGVAPLHALPPAPFGAPAHVLPRTPAPSSRASAVPAHIWPVPPPPHALPRPLAPTAPDASATPPVAPASPALPAPSTIAVPAAGERREMRMAPEVLAAMAAAAEAAGRPESEIWAEAAREWLARHTPDDDPPPPGASQRAPMARATRERTWSAIDVLLGDLRHPRPAASSSPHGVPGAIDPAA